ncbi:hypothetical protein F4780DRAFT_406950 [Xylariomycetidae sp. FL0641]|nr:hypothetical protein F4780DRAFT_406950 [Xylariomycetidae sp. FL0641]
MLIIEEYPIAAYLHELVPQFAFTDCKTYHAGPKDQERAQICEEAFRSKESDSVQVLIQTYRIGSQGLNLQGACHTLMVTTPAHNPATEEPSVARVIRVAQRILASQDGVPVLGATTTMYGQSSCSTTTTEIMTGFGPATSPEPFGSPYG